MATIAAVERASPSASIAAPASAVPATSVARRPKRSASAPPMGPPNSPPAACKLITSPASSVVRPRSRVR